METVKIMSNLSNDLFILLRACCKILKWIDEDVDILKMIGALGRDFALLSYTGPGTTWANVMHFVINNAPGAGSIARPVDHCTTDALLKCRSLMVFQTIIPVIIQV